MKKSMGKIKAPGFHGISGYVKPGMLFRVAKPLLH